MRRFLKCFFPPSPPSTHAAPSRRDASEPPSRVNDELGTSLSSLAERVDAAYRTLATVHSSSLYRRVNALLNVCLKSLLATEARLAIFAADGSTWTLLTSGDDDLHAAPLASSWGQAPLCSLLAEPNAVVVVRGYNPHDGCQASHRLPSSPVSGDKTANGQNGKAQGPAVQSPQPHSFNGAPDPCSLVSRSCAKAVHLQPGDLLALPVRQGGRLAAALLLGWGAEAEAAPQQADGHDAAAGGGGDGLTLSPEDLEKLQRLAQYLGFGVLCDPQQARVLEEIALRLSPLPFSNGLHDFVACLLGAIPELLHLRFGLRFQPLFALTHGLSAGAHAVLFANRRPGQQAQAGVTSPFARNSGAAEDASVRGGGGGEAGVVGRTTSASSLALRVAGAVDVGEASSRVRAVRMSLHHTLIGEALRGAEKAAEATKKQLKLMDSKGLITEPLSSPHGSSLVTPPEPDTTPIATIHPLPAPVPSCAPPQRLHSSVIPNVSAHMLEEGAPCRDLLLCSNLLGGNVGSCVLCVEEPAAVSAAAASPEDSTAACGGGRAGGAPPPSTAAATSSSAGATASASTVLSTPLSALHAQRQFGMYLVCAEALPRAVLQQVAAELQELLGMALGACRDGVLSLHNGGRCGLELLSMQEQLLGLAGAGAGGSAASASAGGLLASAASAPTLLGQVLGPGQGLGALSPMTVGRLVGGAGAGRLGGLSGRPMIRSLFSLAAGAMLPGGAASAANGPASGGHIASASSCRSYHLPPLHTQLSGATPGRPSLALDGGSGSPVPNGGGADDCTPLRWMLATSPEVLLEQPAAGPSPLEVMVSSMRTGLTAALTTAMSMDGTEEAKNALYQELAAIRLYEVIGRGGQGVVFRGTLHGLETAIKVIVHRGKGEPLAHDGGDPGVGAGGEEGAGEGGGDAKGGQEGEGGGEQAGEEGEGQGALSRLRKAKRGAMELVVTGTLSHPNIVQVLASFSHVIMVSCTYHNEQGPRLRLVARDDPILAGRSAAQGPPGPLNTVVCLEYCDAGTLLEAARSGAFRPAGSSVLSGAVRPLLVPLYTSLLEVALALRYLHSRRLVHCDLKPANVLLKSSTRDPRGWTCKLSDFGCVRLMTDLPTTPEDAAHQATGLQPGGLLLPHSAHAQSQRGQGRGAERAGTVLGFRVNQPLGTLAYMAPEYFVRGHTLGAAVDIYAFGILMYEVLMCRTPYSGMDPKSLSRLVLRKHLRPEFHPLVPPEYCHLATRCWSSHASRRPSAAQLVGELEALLAEAQRQEARKGARQYGA